MSKLNNKKICIVVSSLAKGGAERSSALLSVMLDNLGYDVHIVTVLPEIDYKYSGKLLKLGEIKDKKTPFFSRINRLIVFRKYLNKQNFDVIIDNRTRIQAYREFIVTKFIYKEPTIYVIHNFKTSKVFTKYKWLNTYLYKNQIMTSVSEAAKQKFQKELKLNKIQTLYNGFDFDTIKTQAEENIDELSEDYIIFYGRIDDFHKNLKHLLDAYKFSKLAKKNIKLLILGSGPNYDMIIGYVKNLKLEDNVIFKNFISNPYPYVKRAKFMVLSSRFEGFPMVIPETLCLGVPVVSVDCLSGPNEVVKNGYNGLLVENFNVEALGEAFNRFIFDKTLYQQCKENAALSVEAFSIYQISKEWDKLLKKVLI